jgi:hypothetical protein
MVLFCLACFLIYLLGSLYGDGVFAKRIRGKTVLQFSMTRDACKCELVLGIVTCTPLVHRSFLSTLEALSVSVRMVEVLLLDD